MSISVAAEKKLLAPEEFEAVKATHHPAILSLSLEALQSAKRDLGERREKLRVHLVETRRARVRRTAGASPSGEPRLARRKQVFAKALRRLNQELSRREEAEGKARTAPGVPRPEPKTGKANLKPVSAPVPQEPTAAKPARARTAKPKPSEDKGEAKARKATPKKEG